MNFLLDKQASRELKVEFNNVRVGHNFAPKYLGITVDRTLTFNSHIEKTAKKVRSRVNIQLVETEWGVETKTAPVWINSSHIKRINTLIE